MANDYNSEPIVIDTDQTVGWRESQTLSSNTYATGLRITKIMLIAASSTSTGVVSIADPIDSTILYPPIIVAASAAADTVILNDNLDTQSLQWRDFKITGLTATATKILIWYRA
jgi:hypothetical protein